jgi:hypothetical protein
MLYLIGYVAVGVVLVVVGEVLAAGHREDGITVPGAVMVTLGWPVFVLCVVLDIVRERRTRKKESEKRD